MPRADLGRRVDVLERAAGTRTEIARLLAGLTDDELEAVDELHRHPDLWSRCAELTATYAAAGAKPSAALGRAALELHAEAVAAGRLMAMNRAFSWT